MEIKELFWLIILSYILYRYCLYEFYAYKRNEFLLGKWYAVVFKTILVLPYVVMVILTYSLSLVLVGLLFIATYPFQMVNIHLKQYLNILYTKLVLFIGRPIVYQKLLLLCEEDENYYFIIESEYFELVLPSFFALGMFNVKNDYIIVLLYFIDMIGEDEARNAKNLINYLYVFRTFILMLDGVNLFELHRYKEILNHFILIIDEEEIFLEELLDFGKYIDDDKEIDKWLDNNRRPYVLK